MEITVSHPFSFGTPEITVSLNGRYGDLDPQGTDLLRTAILANFIHLPRLVGETVYSGQAELPISGSSDYSSSGDQRSSNTSSSGEYNDQNGQATTRIENANGSIDVVVMIQRSKVQISEQTMQTVADIFAASTLIHGNAAITRRPATYDALAQFYSSSATSEQPRVQQLASAGFSGSSR